MLPPILAAQELLVVLPSRGRRGAPGVAVRLVLLVACAAAYIALRLVLMAPEGASHYSLKSASLAESQLIRRAENPLAFVRGRLEWALSVGWLQVYFAKLLFVPTTYCVEYSYDCVPMVEELSDGRNALTLALLLALLRFAAHLLARAGRPDARATMALSAWLLLPWALVSHVPLRLGTLIAERTLYLPSAGALLLVAHILRPPPRASAVRRAVGPPRGAARRVGGGRARAALPASHPRLAHRRDRVCGGGRRLPAVVEDSAADVHAAHQPRPARRRARPLRRRARDRPRVLRRALFDGISRRRERRRGRRDRPLQRVAAVPVHGDEGVPDAAAGVRPRPPPLAQEWHSARADRIDAFGRRQHGGGGDALSRGGGAPPRCQSAARRAARRRRRRGRAPPGGPVGGGAAAARAAAGNDAGGRRRRA